MTYFYIPELKNITDKMAAWTVAGVTALSLVAGFTTTSVSAADCVRASHQVITDSDRLSTHKTGTPGQSVNYHVELLNNDSLGCGLSDFTITIDGLPAGWSVDQGGYTNELVDAQELTGYSFTVTSPSPAYNGTYNFAVNVSRAEAATVVSQPGSYTIIGGLTQPVTPTPPAPVVDTTAPTIGWVSPGNGSTLRKRTTVTLNSSVSDNIGVKTVEYFVDGARIYAGTQTEFAWTVPSTRSSQTVLEVRVTDAAGNVASKFVTYSIR